MKTLYDLDRILNKKKSYRKIAARYQPIDRLCIDLIHARVAAGISQDELARRMGTKQPAIARVECGFTSPTLAFLERMARALGVQITIVKAKKIKRANKKRQKRMRVL